VVTRKSNEPWYDRIAGVTGGKKGIGLEVCRQLAGNGFAVVLAARDETRGAAAVDNLREAGLSNVSFHQLEVTDALSIARLAGSLKASFGKLDILASQYNRPSKFLTYVPPILNAKLLNDFINFCR
jgi:NAD(P)-dependent dehydrogenase (short-subunit alcohol dehydrogenase family)